MQRAVGARAAAACSARRRSSVGGWRTCADRDDADPASGAQVSKGAGKKKGGGAAKGSASIGADDDADADGGGGRGKKGDKVRAARATA